MSILPLLLRLQPEKDPIDIAWPEYASHLQFEYWDGGGVPELDDVVVIRYIHGEPTEEQAQRPLAFCVNLENAPTSPSTAITSNIAAKDTG